MLKFWFLHKLLSGLAFWDTLYILYIQHSASTSNILLIYSILWNLLLQHQVPSKDHTWGRRSICGPTSSLAPVRSSPGALIIPRTRMTRRTPASSSATCHGADAERQGGRGERGAGGIWGLQQLQGMILYRIGGRRIHSNNQFICEGCHLPCGCGRRDGED